MTECLFVVCWQNPIPDPYADTCCWIRCFCSPQRYCRHRTAEHVTTYTHFWCSRGFDYSDLLHSVISPENSNFNGLWAFYPFFSTSLSNLFFSVCSSYSLTYNLFSPLYRVSFLFLSRPLFLSVFLAFFISQFLFLTASFLYFISFILPSLFFILFISISSYSFLVFFISPVPSFSYYCLFLTTLLFMALRSVTHSLIPMTDTLLRGNEELSSDDELPMSPRVLLNRLHINYWKI
jgi:hypothetical protein